MKHLAIVFTLCCWILLALPTTFAQSQVFSQIISISWSPDDSGSELAFSGSSDEQLNRNIWVVNRDTNAIRILTESMHDALFPKWSYDGSFIAFSSWMDPRDVHVMSTDASFHINLTEDIDSFTPPAYEWSPVENLIAAISDSGDLWLLSLSNTVNLTTDIEDAVTYFRWSPNGMHIIFDTFDEGNGVTKMWLHDIPSQNSIIIHEQATEQGSFFPSWSPDSSLVAYTTVESAEEIAELWTLNTNTLEHYLLYSGIFRIPLGFIDDHTIPIQTQSETLLLNTDGSVRNTITQPTGRILIGWSPDRHYLTYQWFDSETSYSPYFGIMDIETSEFIYESQGRNPVWSPNSAELAYITFTVTRSDIWVMRVDSLEPVSLTAIP